MISSLELQAMFDQAAERGAQRALEKVGLHDEDAGGDVRELRGLLEGWRETKKTVGNTIAKIITTGILALLATGVWMNWGSHK
jgi:hypothetical protein